MMLVAWAGLSRGFFQLQYAALTYLTSMAAAVRITSEDIKPSKRVTRYTCGALTSSSPHSAILISVVRRQSASSQYYLTDLVA